MPKKPSTLFTMQEHPPLSTRFWYPLIVLAVHRASRASVRFELGVVGDDRQAGRTVVHTLPAVLTPNGPLARFLANAFGVHLSERQAFELSKLVGLQFGARFDNGIDGSLQAIVAVRPCRNGNGLANGSATTAEPEEHRNGLG